MAMMHAALFSIAVFLLFALVYHSTVQSIDEQTDHEIRDELTALIGERSVEGIPDITDTIVRRLDDNRSGDFLLLQDARGGRIAGNLPKLAAHDGWLNLLPPEDPRTSRRHKEHVIRGYGHIFEDGTFLFVGRDTYALHQIREIMVRGFLACGLATIAIALFIGVLTSTGVLRRLRAISVASSEIMQGDLSRRLGVGDRNDEFDELAGRVNAMLDRIQGLIEDLQQVTNDIAHDLRTPLARLRQRLELALSDELERCAPGCPIAGTIEKAITEADLLLETFSAMLRIAQIDSGSRRAGFRTVNLSDLLESLTDTYGPVAEDAGHEIRAQIAPGLCINGDTELLIQMFANLIENATKHTPEGSSISVSLTQTNLGPLAVVADNGPGIPVDMRKCALKRFVRLEPSRTTAGSGLGLSLVAAITYLHDITLELGDNHPGLRVSLRFPPSTTA
jgi:signal transduction histidine kinase